jgi:hypothetical protein
MANTLYKKAKDHFLRGDINITTGAFAVALITGADYTPNFDTDEFLAIIPSGAVVGTSPDMTGLATDGDGVVTADNVTIPNLTGAEVDVLVIFEDTGSDATAKLIAYIDTATGLPFTPGGGDVAIVWDTGVNKIFAL